MTDINGLSLRETILRMCKQDKRYASDDLLLIAAIWYQEGWRDPELYKHLKESTTPESIRRTRQMLRMEGLIRGTDEVEDGRFDLMEQVHEQLGY